MVDSAPLTQDKGSKEWEETLLDCLKNPIMCLWSFFVPCGMECMQAVDANYMFRNEEPNEMYIAFLMNYCLCCFGAAYNRGRLREKFDIKGNYLTDALVWCLCCWCAANQEWRTVMAKYNSNPRTPICDLLGNK